MRITGWHINGFGMFADYTVEDLPPGLTVLHGPNEAGKSTVVAYILGILFGFTDGRSKGPRYEPLLGGNHGGKLFLGTDNGEYVVERTKKGRTPTVRSPDGEIGGQETVKDLVGRADRALFRNVFAFSLHELEEIAALQDDSVRERIFATPTFGGGPSARDVVKKLRARETILFRPTASSTISNLRKELETADSELRRAQAEAKSYPRAIADLAEAAGEVDRITDALSAARMEATRYKTLVDVWPQWSDRSLAMSELDSSEVPDGVEPESEERLSTAERQIEQVKVAVRERQGEVDRLRSRLNRVAVDDRLPPISAEIKNLHAGITRYDSDRTRLGNLEGAIDSFDGKISQALADLGPSWSRGRVETFDVSIPARDGLSKWRDILREADETGRQAAERAAALQERMNELSADRRSHEERLEAYASTPTIEEIDASDSATRRLRVKGTELSQYRERVAAADQRVATAREAIEDVDLADSGGVPRSILFGVPSVLAISGAVAGLLGELVAAVLLVVLAVGSGVALAVWKRSTELGPGDRVGEALEKEVRAADEARRQFDSIEIGVRELAEECGFDGVPSDQEIEDQLAAISRLRSDRSTADSLNSLVEQASEKERRTEEMCEQSEKEFEECRSSRERAEEEWNAWRTGRGIREPLSPELVMALIPAISGARDLLGQENAARQEADETQVRVAGFEESASVVLSSAGREDGDTTGTALAAAIETLHRDVLEDEKVRRDIAGLNTGLAGARKSLEEANADLAKAESARDRVLADAGVTDAAALRGALERLRRRFALQEKISDLSLHIDATIGGGPDAAAMVSELESGDLGSWQEKYRVASETVEQVGRQRDEALRDHQDRKTAAEAIARSTDVAQQALDVEGYRQELADALVEWATVATARALIDATLASFERKHQPQVVARAAQLFGRITDGRYPELLSGEAALSVISRSGDSIDVVDLSTGTMQQLYLCLRFALAEEFAERGVRLPLVMDDVLVNFDPGRAERVASVIAEVAERHQVLLLTCHPDTRDLMTQVSPNPRVVEMEMFPR